MEAYWLVYGEPYMEGYIGYLFGSVCLNRKPQERFKLDGRTNARFDKIACPGASNDFF